MKKMFNITQNVADSIFSYSSIALVIGAIITLIATLGIFYSRPIRERYTSERIAINESQTQMAKAEAAMANEKAALANENAAKSNLRAAEVEKQNAELRIKFSNRRIDEKQHEILVKELSKTPSVVNIETMVDPESSLYAADILKTFIDSKWTIKETSFPLGKIWIGVIIYQTNDPAAIYVADAFMKAGINFGIGNEFREKVTIMVGG